MSGILIKIFLALGGGWFLWRQLRKFLLSRIFNHSDDEEMVGNKMGGVKLEKDPETGKFRPANSDSENE